MFTTLLLLGLSLNSVDVILATDTVTLSAPQKTKLRDMVLAFYPDATLTEAQAFTCRVRVDRVTKNKYPECQLLELASISRTVFANWKLAGRNIKPLSVVGDVVNYREAREWVSIIAGNRPKVIAYLASVHPEIAVADMIEFRVIKNTTVAEIGSQEIKSTGFYKASIANEDLAQKEIDGKLLKIVGDE